MPAPLPDIYAPIQQPLHEAGALIRRELEACHPQLAELVGHAARHSGKRIRPALLLLCARACGHVGEHHVGAAATVELIHTATLVHDDVIDDAERRRRGDTVNARWGADVSIMLGDLLFARALELFSRFAGPAEHQLLSGALREVCEGELLQLLARREGDLAEERYLEIIAKKTGALCGASCSLGATLAGRRNGELERVDAFGRCLGIALQIADDCLDIRGDERAVGKTLGLDILGGKLTLPIIHLREAGTDAARERLDHLLASDHTLGLRAQLAHLLADAGAFDYCQRTARRYIQQGADAIAFLDDRPEREALLALAEFVVTRDR